MNSCSKIACPSHAVFESTQWSMVLRAGDHDLPESREALDNLCSIYWYPLYAFARRRGHQREDAWT
ncbi:hypothetical protein [Novipirellula caenicola]|uniref:Uncharacterized protein n=1 Tax=Novipirellula caenicola TaxID=1536901 RepID=A0ABP9VY01_9BACT